MFDLKVPMIQVLLFTPHNQRWKQSPSDRFRFHQIATTKGGWWLVIAFGEPERSSGFHLRCACKKYNLKAFDKASNKSLYHSYSV
jgi:hypothetical protein